MGEMRMTGVGWRRLLTGFTSFAGVSGNPRTRERSTRKSLAQPTSLQASLVATAGGSATSADGNADPSGVACRRKIR
jgi:hypothetical protein